LGKLDRRFGFSVIGGLDEDFHPCIDEITKGKILVAIDIELTLVLKRKEM